MNKEQYREALRDPRWQKRRWEILTRDKFKCRKCKSPDQLTVHHKYYIDGHDPWDYPDRCYITLCWTCHQKEHEGKNISEFIRFKKKRKPRRPRKAGRRRKS